jgi:Ca2+-binding RTX toxin-like protein
VADADAGEGTGEVQVTLAVSNGTLSLGANVGLSFVDGNNTATVVIRGSLTALNTALEGLGYTPDADYSGPDTLTVTTDDLGNTGLPGPLQDIDTVAIQVDAVNDPPVNTVPTTQTLNEDTPLVFSTANGNAITVADVDAEGAGDISVTLTVANGILTLGPTGSLSGFTGDGSGNVALTGQVSAVNAALEDLTYTPNANFNGADSLDITTDDLGNSGSGGPQQDADTIGLQILPVNDAPVVSAPAPQTINQGDSLAFQGAAAIAASDIDIGGGLFMVDIALQTPGNGGSLVLDLDGLILMSPPAATITFFASQTKVNEVLSDGSLVYTPAADFTGTEGVVVTVNDLGGTGLGGALTDTEVVSITVAPSVPLGPIGAVDSTAAPAFTGTDADDVLIGTDGADSIAAGAGDDTVDGGPGNDTLDGGSGNDFLIGSAGDDTFVFEPGSGHDVVKDFVPGAGSEDRLDLRAWGFDDFSDILARTVDVEGDTRIELSDQASIQLVGVASADLHEDDFLL